MSQEQEEQEQEQPHLIFIVKLQPDLEPNQNELEQTWTSRVRSWLCFPMSQEEQQEQPHLILCYGKSL